MLVCNCLGVPYQTAAKVAKTENVFIDRPSVHTRVRFVQFNPESVVAGVAKKPTTLINSLIKYRDLGSTDHKEYDSRKVYK
jgi:hypothetical protein